MSFGLKKQLESKLLCLKAAHLGGFFYFEPLSDFQLTRVKQ
jgi:hypothetical protein